MEDISPGAEPCLEELNSPESQLSCEEDKCVAPTAAPADNCDPPCCCRRSVAGSNSDADESEKEAKVRVRAYSSRMKFDARRVCLQTRTLLSRIDDFRQSYNRVSGSPVENSN